MDTLPSCGVFLCGNENQSTRSTARKIENLPDCTGCTVCFASCAAGAITMTEDGEGFLFPKIDGAKCVSCGTCDAVCPVINQKNYFDELPPAFAAKNRDEKVRATSSSGGAFWALAQYVLEKGGVVFGAKFDENWRIVHDFAENEQDAAAFRTSKYVQSDIGDSFLKCREFLESGRYVLFTGTSCQVNGLKEFLKKDYPNLICADLICHGVPSPKVWREYVEYLEKEKGSKISDINFRYKKNGWKKSANPKSLKYWFADGSDTTVKDKDDPFMFLFLKNRILRNCCYNCPARGFRRASDVTVADFWGVQNLHPELDDDRGISRLFLNTKKVREGTARDRLEKSLELYPIDPAEPALTGGYFKSSPKPKEREQFFRHLGQKGFKSALRKYGRAPFAKRCYLFARRTASILLPKTIKEPLKRIILRKGGAA